jgi:hypothetical protein
MKRPSAKRALFNKRLLFVTGMVLCLTFISVLVFSGYVAAVVGPPLDRAKAHRLLTAAKSLTELRIAVGSLGRVFVLGDGSWVAVRYTDSHAYPGYSCAVALDSGGHWFYSSQHFCGRFRIYTQTEKRTREFASALGDDEAIVRTRLREQDQELYSLASAATLDAARSQLLEIGFVAR